MMPMWLELVFLLGFPVAFILTIIIWAVDYIWFTPKESKIIKKATRKKKPLLDIGFDNGQTEYKIAKKIGDEGYIETEDGWIGFLPRPIGSSGNPGEDTNPKVNQLLTRVSFLKNAKIPIIRGYSGKAVLTNIKTLAALEHTPLAESKKRLKLPWKLGAVNIFWPADLRTIKKVFPKSWNQAQIRASEVKSELAGMLKGKKYFGMEGMKYFVLPAMLIIAIMVIFTLIIIFLPTLS